MKKRNLLLLLLLYSSFCFSQISVFKYPIEFEKVTFQPRDFDSYYLNDPVSQNSILILKDNKKAEYLLLDKNMKLVSKFSPPGSLTNTVFSMQEEYVGGTAADGKFYFAYTISKRNKIAGMYLETVDPQSKTVSNRELFELSKYENQGVAFGNYGNFFLFAIDDKPGEIKIHGLNSAGNNFIKSIKVNIPKSSTKKRLSEYFDGLKVITADEEPGLESATGKVKLFHSPGKISIIVNEYDNPTHIININTETFSSEERLIDHSSLTKGEKGISYVNSFLFNENLYSLILNKKNIRIAVYNSQNGTLLKTHEINDQTNLTNFAGAPVTETRLGKRTDQKDIDDVKKLIKILDKGSEAIMLYKDQKGRFIVTVGTYDLMGLQSGGDTYLESYYSSSGRAGPGVSVQQAGNKYFITVRRPDYPTVITYNANFYKSTRFKLMFDPNDHNLIKGVASPSLNDQIKDYVAEISKKAQAKIQFSVDGKQYFGFYDKEMKMYMIEEIMIRK